MKDNNITRYIPVEVLKILLAKSGGYCQNPGCNRELYKVINSNTYFDIKEAAHIIPFSPNGPRKEELDREAINSPNNLILLCPICHKIIDKAPLYYSAEKLYSWKSIHEEKIKRIFHIVKHNNRKNLFNEINELLSKNKNIFDKYGPNIKNEALLISDKFDLWKKYCVSTIIPNNKKIFYIINANKHLLNKEEMLLLNDFEIHINDFEFNHISGEKNSSAILFPIKLFQLLEME